MGLVGLGVLVEVSRLDGGGGSVGAVGRQDVDAVLVMVCVAQPFGQAVWQGRREVTVGVLEQRLLGPGMIVVLCIC